MKRRFYIQLTIVVVLLFAALGLVRWRIYRSSLWTTVMQAERVVTTLDDKEGFSRGRVRISLETKDVGTHQAFRVVVKNADQHELYFYGFPDLLYSVTVKARDGNIVWMHPTAYIDSGGKYFIVPEDVIEYRFPAPRLAPGDYVWEMKLNTPEPMSAKKLLTVSKGVIHLQADSVPPMGEEP